MIKKRFLIFNIILLILLSVLNVFVWSRLEPYELYSLVEFKDKYGRLMPYNYEYDSDYGVLKYVYGNNKLIYEYDIDFSQNDPVSGTAEELKVGTDITDEPLNDETKLKDLLTSVLGKYYDLSDTKFTYSVWVDDNNGGYVFDTLEEALSYKEMVVSASFRKQINGILTRERLSVSLDQDGVIKSFKIYENDIYEKYNYLNIDEEHYRNKLEKTVKAMCVKAKYKYLYCKYISEYLIEYKGELCIYTYADGFFASPTYYNDESLGVKFLTPLTGVPLAVKIITTAASAVLLAAAVTVSIIISRKKAVTPQTEQEETE